MANLDMYKQWFSYDTKGIKPSYKDNKHLIDTLDYIFSKGGRIDIEQKYPYDSAVISCEWLDIVDGISLDHHTFLTKKFNYPYQMPEIKNVEFRDPLTIVIWEDGTKTFVRCADDETYNPEKGLAMAIVKKIFGNKYKSTDIIKEWIDKDAERIAKRIGKKGK